MINIKHTEQYAQQLAIKEVPKIKQSAYVKGYLRAVEETENTTVGDFIQEIEHLKGKTNYDEIEVLKELIKDKDKNIKEKDKMLNQMADWLEAIKFNCPKGGNAIKQINNLLNKFNK